MVRSLASWLWLIGCGTGKALDASEEAGGDFAASLMTHFDEVHVLRADPSVLDSVRADNAREGWVPASLTSGTVRDAPWPPGTFDCIALHDALAHRPPAAPGLLEDLRPLHRLLRPGGWLEVAAPNPRLPGRRAAGTFVLPRGRLSRLLVRAGFREVRCWFAAPTLARPLTLLPDARAAIRAYEASDAMRGATSWPRRAIAGFGTPSVLYPAYVLLARA